MNSWRSLATQIGKLTLVACVVGCDREIDFVPASGNDFTDIYSELKPKNEFAGLGLDVDDEIYAGRLSVSKSYGWRPYQGTLELPDDKASCELVAESIRLAVERRLGAPCQDELTPETQRPRGRPFYGMLRYEHQGMHGRVFIWLFPDESETRMSYAILIHEQRASDSARLASTQL